MNNFIEELKTFFSTGNNLYYVIAAAVVLVVLIVVAVVLAVRAKRKKAAVAEPEDAGSREVESESADFESEGIDVDKLVVDNEACNAAASESFILKPPEKYVSENVDSIVMTPVKEEPRPPKKEVLPPPEPQEKESSFKDHVYSKEAAKRPGTIQIYLDNGGKYRFRLKSSNLETVGHSQGYTTKAACKNGINAVVNACKTAEVVDTTKSDEYVASIGRTVFEIYRDNERKFRFRLTAANASNILASQGYTSKVNCINGTESVRNIAAFHNLVDDTKAVKRTAAEADDNAEEQDANAKKSKKRDLRK